MSSGEKPAGSHLRLVGAIAGVGSGCSRTRVCSALRQAMSLTISLTHWETSSFDTIKTRVQCSPPGTYRGAIHVLTTTIRNEGFLALYKGATPPAVGWAAIDSVLLGSLHNYRLFLLRHGFTEPDPHTGINRLTLQAHGIAGACAGLTSAILATPIELLKVKLQLQLQKSSSERQFKGPIDCARQIIRAQGVQGLWTGLSGTLAVRLNFFWMFLSFEACFDARFLAIERDSVRGAATLLSEPNSTDCLLSKKLKISTGAANFFAGGLASFAFWGAAIPADNVKNRMMSHPYPHPYPSPPIPPSTVVTRPSFLAVALQIHARDGFAGFFRGLGPCIVRAFPVNACALFVYEGIMTRLGAEKTRH